MMEKDEREWIQEELDNLPYVEWDRYITIPTDEQGHVIHRFFGWIDREQDSYKDFVVIELVPHIKGVFFISTSSAKYSNDISNRLRDVHIVCKQWDNLK